MIIGSSGLQTLHESMDYGYRFSLYLEFVVDQNEPNTSDHPSNYPHESSARNLDDLGLGSPQSCGSAQGRSLLPAGQRAAFVIA